MRKENGNLIVQLKEENANLKEKIRDLKDKNDKYMIDRAVEKQLNKKTCSGNFKIEKSNERKKSRFRK